MVTCRDFKRAVILLFLSLKEPLNCRSASLVLAACIKFIVDLYQFADFSRDTFTHLFARSAPDRLKLNCIVSDMGIDRAWWSPRRVLRDLRVTASPRLSVQSLNWYCLVAWCMNAAVFFLILISRGRSAQVRPFHGRRIMPVQFSGAQTGWLVTRLEIRDDISSLSPRASYPIPNITLRIKYCSNGCHHAVSNINTNETVTSPKNETLSLYIHTFSVLHILISFIFKFQLLILFSHLAERNERDARGTFTARTFSVISW